MAPGQQQLAVTAQIEGTLVIPTAARTKLFRNRKMARKVLIWTKALPQGIAWRHHLTATETFSQPLYSSTRPDLTLDPSEPLLPSPYFGSGPHKPAWKAAIRP